MNIPLEVFDLLERRLGREDALAVAKSIEASLTHLEERSKEIAAQRKLEVKEELKRELRDELTTKEDLAKLDKKFTVYFLVTIFAVIFVNQNALEFLARLLRLMP